MAIRDGSILIWYTIPNERIVHYGLQLSFDFYHHEVFQWLNQNCSGEWESIMTPTEYRNSRGQRKVFDTATIGFIFEHAEDAMFFKMRWC